MDLANQTWLPMVYLDCKSLRDARTSRNKMGEGKGEWEAPPNR